MQLDAAFARYRRGRDSAALGEVFDLAAPEVLRIATYLVRDADVAEDLVQQTFLGVIEGADRFDDGRAVMPWMLGILANQVRAHKRREARSPDTSRLGVRAQDDPARAAAHREVESAVRAAIDRIDEPYRSILRLNLDEGLAPKEIAVSLDRPQGTVRSQLHRGLDMLRKALPVGLSLGIVSNTRGLAAVKSDVLASAGLTGGGAGGVAASGAMIMTKKTALVLAAVLVVAALLTWNRLAGSESDGARTRATNDRGAVARVSDAPDEMHDSEDAARDAEAAPGEPHEFEESEEDERAMVVRVQIGGQRAAGIGVVVRPLGGGDGRVYRQLALTDEHGRVKFAELPPGDVAVSLTTGAGAQVDPDETGSVDLAGDPGITVHGRVLDRHGAPVENAVIEANWGRVLQAVPLGRSSADGRFSIPHLEPGALLTARAAGFVATPLAVVDGRPGDRVEMDFRLETVGGSARIRVVDASAQPLPGAVVFIGRFERAAKGGVPPVRSEGPNEIVGLAPGAHPLVVRAKGHRPLAETMTISAGTTTERTVVMERSAVVTGRVRWANGDTVARIPVEQMTAGPRTLLDAVAFCDVEGRFRLDEIAPDSFSLRVRRPGFAPAVRAFRMAPGESAEWEVVLGEKHALRGTLTNAKGAALAGWIVRALTPDKLQATTRTGDDGSFALSVNDPEATYHLAALNPNGERRWCAEATAKGTREPLQLVVKPASPRAIVGRLVDGAGKPVGGVHVFVSRPDDSAMPSAPSSHKDGVFRIREVKPGAMRIVVFDPTGKRPVVAVSDLEVPEGGPLDVGTIRVTEGGRVRIRVEASEEFTQVAGFVQEWWAGFLQKWQVEADGARVSPLIAAGTVRIGASGTREGKMVRKHVDAVVRPGETTEVTLTLD
ncbi:MAG: sigma-70 family RNA polymerase sigma factor [Planctomycetota bacterium]|jgi:RNA polymerase sigma-70 factor (ECF subfamily)